MKFDPKPVESWEPSDEVQQLCVRLGLDFYAELEKFKTSAADRDKRYADWDAAFRTWLRGGISDEHEIAAQPEHSVDDADAAEATAKLDEMRRSVTAPNSDPHPLGANGAELLDSIWRNMMINHARAHNIPVGKAKCEHCGQLRDWGDDPTCGCEQTQELRESRSVRRQQVDSVSERLIPDGMRWARLGTPEWIKVETKEPRVGDFVRRWNRDAGSVIILGPTGAGKTAAAIALLQRILNRAGKPEETEKNFRWAMGMRFIDASELVVARRNSKLGDEADLVEKAKSATLLVLDELGFETFSPVPYEVINARYLSGSPTIITSGLRSRSNRDCKDCQNEFAKRYGAAFMRRITDRGGIINLWEKDS